MRDSKELRSNSIATRKDTTDRARVEPLFIAFYELGITATQCRWAGLHGAHVGKILKLLIQVSSAVAPSVALLLIRFPLGEFCARPYESKEACDKSRWAV